MLVAFFSRHKVSGDSYNWAQVESLCKHKGLGGGGGG